MGAGKGVRGAARPLWMSPLGSGWHLALWVPPRTSVCHQLVEKQDVVVFGGAWLGCACGAAASTGHSCICPMHEGKGHVRPTLERRRGQRTLTLSYGVLVEGKAPRTDRTDRTGQDGQDSP